MKVVTATDQEKYTRSAKPINVVTGEIPIANGIKAAPKVCPTVSGGVTRPVKKYVAINSLVCEVGLEGYRGPPGLVQPVSWRNTRHKTATNPSRATLYQNCTVQETSSTMKPEKVPPATVPRRMQQV